MNILVLNAGSSSLKVSLIESAGEQVLADGLIDYAVQPPRLRLRRPGQQDLVQNASSPDQDLTLILSLLPAAIDAVGHRVVHGGNQFIRSVQVTASVKDAIRRLEPLAPLHNPFNLQGIERAEAALPGVPQVAVFDTAFHAALPPEHYVYPVPYRWLEEWGIRRYGFHGISHAYCAGRAAELLGRGDARLIICHLGNGASISAVANGRCVDTSMGFTPLEGLMMGTRSGSIDPGLLLHLQERHGFTAAQLDHALNHESGLLGVSGVSADLRQVLAAAEQGGVRAMLAISIYVHRIQQVIGSMAATLGGVDALVFTAGVGENAAGIRAQVCARLSFLGLHLDPAANAACTPDADMAALSSPGRLLVIATHEERMIARETAGVLQPR